MDNAVQRAQPDGARRKRPPIFQWSLTVILVGVCALAPWVATVYEAPFWVDVFARAMIWAIAAISLNLILGYGGMVSFGHAIYLGVGGYVVGVFAYHEITSGWLQWPLALLVCAFTGLIFGLISLRTRGVYFIMITMALSQMVYFLMISIEEYGSDDGLIVYDRSDFGLALLNLDNEFTRYYVIFACLVLTMWLVSTIVKSRFGRVVQGIRSNEARMQSLGYPVFRYRLACFVIAAVICGLAGILSVNVEKFISPDTMHWTRSGELIFMVVLGGIGNTTGALAGALVFWLLQEQLATITEHWHLIFGPFLLLVVLLAPRGIHGIFRSLDGEER